jgi:hypothetical protein
MGNVRIASRVCRHCSFVVNLAHISFGIYRYVQAMNIAQLEGALATHTTLFRQREVKIFHDIA